MTHYDEFGVAPTATLEEIQRAHRSLARLLHPDHIADPEARRVAETQLKRLNSIYQVLIDPDRRRLYDLQLIRPPGLDHLARRHVLPLPGAGPAGSRRWFAPAAIAFLCLGAGFQFGGLWSAHQFGPPAVQAGDRTPAAAAAHQPRLVPSPASLQAAAGTGGGEGAAAHRRGADVRQATEENRELRRALQQALLERDQAASRLAAQRLPTPSSAAAPPDPAPQPAFHSPSPPSPIANSAPSTTPTPAPAEPAQSSLSGTWIYSVANGRPAPDEQYPAEYIELFLVERNDVVWGRYRARYTVSDRALNPEVEFFFEGKSRTASSNRFVWSGNGGAKGEVALKLLSDTMLSMDWFTSQLGRTLTLSSGRAVLVRRRDQ